jgi:DNA-binding CsgD family transcriptional regulator
MCGQQKEIRAKTIFSYKLNNRKKLDNINKHNK